jgi:hypothetical protein
MGGTEGASDGGEGGGVVGGDGNGRWIGARERVGTTVGTAVDDAMHSSLCFSSKGGRSSAQVFFTCWRAWRRAWHEQPKDDESNDEAASL